MYQAIHHTHYQKGKGTRSVEDFLNLLNKDFIRRATRSTAMRGIDFSLRIVAVNLVNKNWDPRYYEILEWHILIWGSHVYTDDELSPMLHKIHKEED